MSTESSSGPEDGAADGGLITVDLGAGPPDPSAGGLNLHHDTWGISWSGLRTVAWLELRQRVRSKRWLVVLGLWVLLLVGLTTLISWAIQQQYSWAVQNGGPAPTTAEHDMIGSTVFGGVIFMVLSLAALVSPALTATSINGDRASGVLATLQATLLTPAEIVLGKLLAAWGIALVLLAAATPCLVYAVTLGGTSASRLAATLATTALTLLVVCAIALGWSALMTRTSTSSVMTYLTVTALGLGLPVLFALSTPLVTSNDAVPTWNGSSVPTAIGTEDGLGVCTLTTQYEARPHTERIWWLLAASPYVIVADAGGHRGADPQVGSDLLTGLADGVRDLRLGPEPMNIWCDSPQAAADLLRQQQERTNARNALGAIWGAGLALDLGLGAVMTWVAVRRLRVPMRRLAKGTRIA